MNIKLVVFILFMLNSYHFATKDAYGNFFSQIVPSDNYVVQIKYYLLNSIKLSPLSKSYNRLYYGSAQQELNLDQSEKNIYALFNINPKDINFMNTLGWVYFKMGQLYLAEKTFIHALGILENALTYNYLGDIYLALKEYTKAWTAYSLSYDFNKDKYLKKKLHSVASQISKEEIFNLMLLRSKNNYDHLVSFKTGFKTKIASMILSKTFYISVIYNKKKNFHLRAPYLPGLSDVHIIIQDGILNIEPNTAKMYIPNYILNIIYQLPNILSDNFYKQFLDAKPVKKNGTLIYSKGDSSLVIDSNTSLIKKLSKNNIVVEILKYESFTISKIPTTIKVYIPYMNIKMTLIATKILKVVE